MGRSDPYVLKLLNLKANTTFYEQELEQTIIDKLQEFLLKVPLLRHFGVCYSL
ncbi:hypothetical protein [Pedobacter sp. WC2423]|uniref:hypothetical protein n=1 Tax=Pedobacter sp. WC2423 TaxID=3234142 RepID=UPI003464EBCD